MKTPQPVLPYYTTHVQILALIKKGPISCFLIFYQKSEKSSQKPVESLWKLFLLKDIEVREINKFLSTIIFQALHFLKNFMEREVIIVQGSFLINAAVTKLYEAWMCMLKFKSWKLSIKYLSTATHNLHYHHFCHLSSHLVTLHFDWFGCFLHNLADYHWHHNCKGIAIYFLKNYEELSTV